MSEFVKKKKKKRKTKLDYWSSTNNSEQPRRIRLCPRVNKKDGSLNVSQQTNETRILSSPRNEIRTNLSLQRYSSSPTRSILEDDRQKGLCRIYLLSQRWPDSRTTLSEPLSARPPSQISATGSPTTCSNDI